MPKIVFSSEQLPGHLDERARYKLWLDLFTDHLCTADISFLPDVPFYSHSEFIKFGELAVTQLNGNIQSAVRTRRHVQNDTRGDYIIGTMLSNTRSLIKQDGREAVRGAGQTVLYSNAAPIDARHDAALLFRGVTVPQKLLAERVSHFEDLAITPLAPSPALRHLERYLAILVGSDVNADAVLESNVGAHLLDLIALALGARGDSSELANLRGLRAARLQEALAEINRGFADPNFSPVAMATKLGLSPRYIQDLLQETGATLSERVLELRLQKTRLMLSDARHDRMRISEIALACGFNDVSYFNRRFRARFGCSPTEYRGANGKTR
jgi:AraC-like DNA-binding protein